jgi:hypothetical protein
MNIGSPRQKVLLIPHSPIMEARLPDDHFMPAFPVNAVRGASLDVLHCLFKRDGGRGCNEYVKMVGHNDKSMKKACALFPVVKNLRRDDPGQIGRPE